jgi:hypothetical protein
MMIGIIITVMTGTTVAVMISVLTTTMVVEGARWWSWPRAPWPWRLPAPYEQACLM